VKSTDATCVLSERTSCGDPFFFEFILLGKCTVAISETICDKTKNEHHHLMGQHAQHNQPSPIYLSSPGTRTCVKVKNINPPHLDPSISPYLPTRKKERAIMLSAGHPPQPSSTACSTLPSRPARHTSSPSPGPHGNPTPTSRRCPCTGRECSAGRTRAAGPEVDEADGGGGAVGAGGGMRSMKASCCLGPSGFLFFFFYFFG
jgi:hypothetical protein